MFFFSVVIVFDSPFMLEDTNATQYVWFLEMNLGYTHGVQIAYWSSYLFVDVVLSARRWPTTQINGKLAKKMDHG